MKEFFRKIDESVGIYRFVLNAIIITILLVQFLWGFIGGIWIALIHFNTVFTGNILFWIMLFIVGNIIIGIVENVRKFNKSKKAIISTVEGMYIEILTPGIIFNTPSGVDFITKLVWKNYDEKYDTINTELCSSKVYTQNNYKITDEQIATIKALKVDQISLDWLLLSAYISIMVVLSFLFLPPLKINPMDITIHLYKKDLEYSTMEYKQEKEDRLNRINELNELKEGYSKIGAVDKVSEIQTKIDLLGK